MIDRWYIQETASQAAAATYRLHIQSIIGIHLLYSVSIYMCVFNVLLFIFGFELNNIYTGIIVPALRCNVYQQ